MDANALLTSNIAGSLQKYFTKLTMNLPFYEYDSVLANAETGVAGNVNIPGNAGQMVEYRFFNQIDPEQTSTTNHAPKLYAATAEPSAGTAITATVYRTPLTELVKFLSFGTFLTQTDPIDLMDKAFEAMKNWQKRTVHQVVNQNFVNQLSDTNSFTADLATAKLPPPFPSMYAGGATSFTELLEDSFITMRDIARAVAVYDNTPQHRNKYPDGNYRCVIDHAIKNHFIQNDPSFRDFVKRHEDKANTVLTRNTLPVWNNVVFLVQDDPYRCNLASAGGDANTRYNTGLVHAAHFLNKDAFGYVDLAGKDRLVPKFKIQDITITGVEVTAGVRVKFQSSPIRPSMGLNIFGTTEFNETTDDFAIAA